MSTNPPLDGIRILDLTRVWSGPLATRVLADLGAEVIKIEHPGARGPSQVGPLDPIRASNYPGNQPGEDPWNRNASFNKLNRNKLGVAIDIATPEGREIMLGLAAVSDVVIENYSPRVMGNLGIGFDSLRERNPRIVLVSMPGYGLDGPMRDRVAYGSTLDAECGIAALMGYEGEGPQRLGVALPDPAAGLHAAGAIVTALLQRERTGRGQHIDLSQLESVIGFMAEDIIAYQLTGNRRKRMGNRHAWMAPHGIFPCHEPDTWVFVGVESDVQWQALAAAIGQGALATDTRFATIVERKRNEHAAEVALSAWTRTQTPASAMTTLQAARIPAGAVHDAPGLLHDPHLRARGFFVQLHHPTAGRHEYPGQPIHLSGTPASFRSDAPRLGEHNRYVIEEILGYTSEAVNALLAARVIAERPPV